MRSPVTWLIASALTALLALPLQGAQEATSVSALDRSPSEWPAAEPGRWDGWDADVPPPLNVVPFLQRAINAFERADMPATLQALFELLAAEPDFPSALHQAGVIYFRLRRYGDAIAALERYLAIAPHRVGDTRYLAHSYYSLGQYEAAREHYRRVLAVRPKSPEARRGLGLCHMRLGDPELALIELRRVLELDPPHANAAAWIAQIHFDEERVEAALEAALKARRLDPYDPRTWFLTSQIYYELERDEEGDAARARFDTLDRAAQEARTLESQLLFEPGRSACFQRLVLLHRGIGDMRGASRVLQRWLKADPRSLAARVMMLRHAQDTGDAKSAAAVAASLRSLAGDDVNVWRALRDYFQGANEPEAQAEAEAQLRRLGRAR